MARPVLHDIYLNTVERGLVKFTEPAENARFSLLMAKEQARDEGLTLVEEFDGE